LFTWLVGGVFVRCDPVILFSIIDESCSAVAIITSQSFSTVGLLILRSSRLTMTLGMTLGNGTVEAARGSVRNWKIADEECSDCRPESETEHQWHI